MAVDANLVRRKIRLILEDLARLRPIAERELEAHLADPDRELVAERLLERMIGRMIDINYHLLVEHGQMPPSDYRDSFLRLSSLSVLDREQAEALARAAGLRNRLAHEYNGIDEALVHAAARRALVEVPEYLRRVEGYLGRLTSVPES